MKGRVDGDVTDATIIQYTIVIIHKSPSNRILTNNHGLSKPAKVEDFMQTMMASQSQNVGVQEPKITISTRDFP